MPRADYGSRNPRRGSGVRPSDRGSNPGRDPMRRIGNSPPAHHGDAGEVVCETPDRMTNRRRGFRAPYLPICRGSLRHHSLMKVAGAILLIVGCGLVIVARLAVHEGTLRARRFRPETAERLSRSGVRAGLAGVVVTIAALVLLVSASR